MMNQTSTDYSFQVAGPTADRAPAVSRRGDGRPPFGDHLTQVSVRAPEEPSTAKRPAFADSDADPRGNGMSEVNSGVDGGADDAGRDADATSQAGDNAGSADSVKKVTAIEVAAEEKIEAAIGETAVIATGDVELEPPAGAAENTPAGPDIEAVAAEALTASIAAVLEVDVVTSATTPAAAAQQSPTTQQIGAAIGEQSLATAGQTSEFVEANESAGGTGKQLLVPPQGPEPDVIETATKHPSVTLEEANGVRAQRASAQTRDDERGPAARRQSADAVRHETPIAEPASEAVEAKSVAPLATATLAADDAATENEFRRPGHGRGASRLAPRTEAAAVANTPIIVSAKTATMQATEAASPADVKEDTVREPAKPVAPKTDTLAALLARSQSGASKAIRDDRAAESDDAPRVDAARFIGRVAKAFQTAHERGGTLQLRLSPPELGSLRIELMIQDGVMTAALETETATARRVLLDHLPALRERLAEQNIRIERFDVDMRDEGRGGQADDRAPQQQRQEYFDRPAMRRHNAPHGVAESAARETHSTPLASNQGINLIV